MIKTWNYTLKTYEVSFVGAVLEMYTENVRWHMSDWTQGYFAKVWDEAMQCVRSIQYDLDGDWYSEKRSNEATIDGTEEAFEKANAWERMQEEKARKSRELAEAKRLERGKKVRVVRGRKISKGVEGVAFWVKPMMNKFSHRMETRVGFKTANGDTYFTSAYNVEVVIA